MIIKRPVLSKDEGRKLFIQQIKNLGIDDNEKLTQFEMYYNRCWIKAYDSNVTSNTNVLFLCNSKPAGKTILDLIKHILVEQGLFKADEIGIDFLETKEDVSSLVNILKTKELYLNFKTILIACYNETCTAQNKNVLDAQQLLKKAGDNSNDIYFRKLATHIDINIDIVDIYTNEVINRLEKIRECNEEFKEGLKEYIYSIPPREQREIKDDEAFIIDILNRVLHFYYSQNIPGNVFDVNCVPQYIAEEDKMADLQNPIEYEFTDLSNYSLANELTAEEQSSVEIKNVLILGMSTLPFKNPLTVNAYRYNSKNNGEYKVYGYAQLDPVPQILMKEISEGNLDLIIITATDSALKQQNKTIVYEADSELCKEEDKGRTINYKCSAVELFKYHMINKFKNKNDIKFKTIEIDEKDMARSLYDLTTYIHDIHMKNKFRLYMDIHGGPREIQTVFDAAITVLGIENIEIQKVFTSNFGSGADIVNDIQDVTDGFQIFKLVSGIYDFINHGSTYEIKKYVDKCQNENQGNRENLVESIQKISDALLLCKLSGFESALDILSETMKTGFENDYIFQIFMEIVKADYGKLLEEDRSLYDEIKWAYQKDLYQQALTLIEAKTPMLVMDKYFIVNSLSYTKNGYPTNAKTFRIDTGAFKNEKLGSILYRTMFFENGKFNNMDIDSNDNVLSYTCIGRDKSTYNVSVDLKSTINLTVFQELGSMWWDIKSNIRNAIMHSNDTTLSKIIKDSNYTYALGEKNINIVVSKQIESFLEKLKELLEEK